jgi:putative membrane-bound dehydrogenase-like protein
MRSLRLASACGALCVAACANAATFDFGELPLTVPDGFVVERVAGPPLIERPVTCDFDEAGRLYVAESSGSNAPLAEQRDDPQHRVLRLEDSDGDGVFDSRTVFADGLMMLQGTLWHDGSLYVAAAPEILKLTDTDGDGVADLREVWHDGGTLTGCGNDLHGPYLAPDGRIEFTKGAFAEQTHDLVGKPGWSTRASHVFRCRPDHTELEAVMTGGMDNPVDVAFTPSGERLLSATFLTHPAGGERDGVAHAVYGGVFGKEHGVLEGHPRTGDLLPPLIHLGPAAACGLHVHSGFAHGSGWAGDVFACSFNLRQVTRHTLTPIDGSFAVVTTPFLTADSADFHPTDVIEDADGSLLVVDTGGWYKLCCPTSQMEKPAVPGGIYRVRQADRSAPVDPRGLQLNWDSATATTLAARLADERPAVGRRAVEALADSGETAVLAELLASTETSSAARLRAVWCLARIDSTAARGAVRACLTDSDATVRAAAVHVAGLHRDAEATTQLVDVLLTDAPEVARPAAEALGRIGSEEAVAGLLERATMSQGRFLDHSVTFALLEAGRTDQLRAALAAENPDLRRCALVALAQQPSRGSASPAWEQELRHGISTAVASRNTPLRAAGLWLLSRRPAWAADVVSQLPQVLSEMSRASLESQRQLVTQLARLADVPEVAATLAAGLEGDLASPQAQAVLAVMQQARLKQVPESWVRTLAAGLAASDSHDPAAVARVISTLSQLSLSEEQRQTLRPELIAVAVDGEMPVTACLQAVQAAGTAKQLPLPLISRLRDLLTEPEAGSPLDRSAAADFLAEAQLDEADLRVLAAGLGQLPASDVARLLPMLTNAGGVPLTDGLAALITHPRPDMLPRAMVEAAVVRATEDGAAVPPLLAQIDAAATSQRKRFAQLAESLPDGDASRGHRVFLSAKAACITCHAMAYAGGRIGPDLTKIGSIRSPTDLLEAIVLPSASFVRSYEPVVVLTVDGKLIAGIPQEPDAQQLVVQTSASESVVVPREEIEQIERGEVSLMPSGYEMLFSPQELADLVAFLARAR